MRIFFICPASKKAIGGNKMLYRGVDRLNELGLSAYAFHPRRITYRGTMFRWRSVLMGTQNPFEKPEPGFSYTWFQHRTRVYGETKPLCSRSDILIIPEVMAPNLVPIASKFGFRYVIFVQNGHLIDSGEDQFGRVEILRFYQEAEVIWSISEHSSKLLHLAFPELQQESIARVLVDLPVAPIETKKESIITYMPRKLASHAQKMIFLLQGRLPRDWSLQAIHGVGEAEAFRSLARSKIFISFSELEGFGLPPVEAAMHHNLVVGYSGGGGTEYFEPPIFREVSNGDFETFVSQVLLAVSDWESWRIASLGPSNQLNSLRHRYSRSAQLDCWKAAIECLL